ncbi:MAG: hypothetical protein OXR66_02770 [Candidatus Woesearchaeota archaeon]|nr:hypothetical protein [Candidatus Woesearchaeota archaeon]
MVVFIVAPKNSGLKNYKNIALTYLSDVENILEVRGEDVPFWVEKTLEKGKKALGLTGEDLFKEYILEQRSDLRIIKRIAWNDAKTLYGKPALCLIGPEDKRLDILPKQLTIGIPKKYKKIAKKYLNFLERKGFSFRKMYLGGSVEATCLHGITDLVIDIVYSGRTMKENGLTVYEKIMTSDFVIIGGKNDTNLQTKRNE